MSSAVLQDPAPATPSAAVDRAQPWLRGGAAPGLDSHKAAAAADTGVDVAAGALAFYAQVLGARSVQAAAHRVVASLCADFALARAGLGIVEPQGVRLLAVSDLAPERLHDELPLRLTGALNEAAEQGMSLAWPAAGGVAAAGVLLEHRQLHALVGAGVASVPLGSPATGCCHGEVFAAVVVQAQPGAVVSPELLLRLEQLLSLAAPALRWLHEAQQPWHRRTARDLGRAWMALRQPERATARRLMAGAALALAFTALAPLQREASGRARIEGAEQRALMAPADGFVKAVHVRPGDRVQQGAPLVDLLDGDLRLERERWSSQLAQHENAYAAAMAKPDRTAAATSLARISEAQSQLALVDEQLARGRVAAPFDAIVIQGDLSRSIGAPVRQGDTLLTLATTDQYRVIVDIDETDIAAVQPGQAGRLSLSSWSWRSQDIVVERITPLARAVEGRNVFEVEARLLEPGAELRPGLLGRAELVVGRRPPLWTWLGHAADRMRLAWWSWLG